MFMVRMQPLRRRSSSHHHQRSPRQTSEQANSSIGRSPQSKIRERSRSFKLPQSHMLRSVGIAVTGACAVWSLCYVLFGATPDGKEWYSQFSKKIFDDYKGGVPMVTLAIPVLIAGTVSTLLNVNKSSGLLARTILPWLHRVSHTRCTVAARGDVNFGRMSFVFVFVPLLIYLMASIRRHLQGTNMSYDEKVMEVSNSFAIMALLSFSFFLIPVARHSVILKLLDWTPAAAVRLHVWSGRMVIVGVLVHGIMHMYRWVSISGESLVGMLIPPSPCWTLANDSDFEPTCNDPDSDCSCYYHFRNLTGFLAALGLIVIAVTTVNYVRRRYYRVFYLAHIWAAPAVIIASILHWNRTVLYLAPSLLYYAANSIPILMESTLQRKRDGGVKVMSVERIMSSEHGRPCVSLTVAVSDEASVNYRPGQYIKLLAPKISMVPHPFTVNRVMGKPGQLRIIFRVTGSFTSKLANLLVSGTKPPRLHVDGFLGNTQRVDQVLKHDAVVMVAGGIGITPFLSILQEVHSILVARLDAKEIILHWMCRDKDLVKCVKAHYFDPLLRKASIGTFRMRLVVHKTDMDSTATSHLRNGHQDSNGSELSLNYVGEPFSPSSFSSGTTGSLIGNITPFVTFGSIGWIGLWVVWSMYDNVIKEDEITGRGWACLALVIVAIVFAGLANLALHIIDRVQAQGHNPMLIETTGSDDETEVEMGTIGNGIANERLLAKVDDELSESNVSVSYEEQAGRPVVRELLKSLAVDHHPGLFMCGPRSLMQAIRSEVKDCCPMPRISIYEETFET